MLGGFSFVISTLFQMSYIAVVSQLELPRMFLVSHVRAYCQFYLVTSMGFQNFGTANVFFKVNRHKLLLSWRRTYSASYVNKPTGVLVSWRRIYSASYVDNHTGVTYPYLVNSKYRLAFCCHVALLSYITTIYNTVQQLVYILISVVETCWLLFETALPSSYKFVQLWRYCLWLARSSCILPVLIYIACDQQ
jgi:hypothetical protein